MVEHEGQQGQAYDLRVGGEVGGDQGYTYGQRFLRGCVEHGDRVFAGEAEQPGPPIGDQEEKDMGYGQIPEGTEHGPQVSHELGVPGGFREGEKQDQQDEDTAGHGEAFSLLHRNFS